MDEPFAASGTALAVEPFPVFFSFSTPSISNSESDSLSSPSSSESFPLDDCESDESDRDLTSPLRSERFVEFAPACPGALSTSSTVMEDLRARSGRPCASLVAEVAEPAEFERERVRRGSRGGTVRDNRFRGGALETA